MADIANRPRLVTWLKGKLPALYHAHTSPYWLQCWITLKIGWLEIFLLSSRPFTFYPTGFCSLYATFKLHSNSYHYKYICFWENPFFFCAVLPVFPSPPAALFLSCLSGSTIPHLCQANITTQRDKNACCLLLGVTDAIRDLGSDQSTDQLENPEEIEELFVISLSTSYVHLHVYSPWFLICALFLPLLLMSSFWQAFDILCHLYFHYSIFE